jgi:hypothetical protein
MKFVWGAVFLVLASALFVAMARTWRTRSRKQADLVPGVPVPAGLGQPVGSWDGFVVATTFADAPLERVTAGGLGFRSRGGFTVHPEGVIVSIAGVPDRWVASDHIRGADRQHVVIDRVVEPGGLIRLRWTATGTAAVTDLDTYFRFPESDADALAALQELTGTTQGEQH